MISSCGLCLYDGLLLVWVSCCEGGLVIKFGSFLLSLAHVMLFYLSSRRFALDALDLAIPDLQNHELNKLLF